MNISNSAIARRKQFLNMSSSLGTAQTCPLMSIIIPRVKKSKSFLQRVLIYLLMALKNDVLEQEKSSLFPLKNIGKIF